MRRHDDGSPGVAVGREERGELGPRAGVLPEGRLVEQQHARLGRERGGDRQPALLAAAQQEGARRREVRQPQSLEQGVDALGVGPADGELIAHRRGHELVLGVLEDDAEPLGELGRGPSRGVPGAEGLDRAGGGREQAREREQQRALARAVGPREGDDLARAHGEVEAAREPDDVSPGGLHGEACRAQQLVSRRRDRGGRMLGPAPGNPHAAPRQPRPLLEQHLGDGAVGHDPPAVEHDDAVDERGPDVDAVFDDDERQPAVGDERGDGRGDLAHAGGVELSRGLVEQEGRGAHREHAREGETLLLPAREPSGVGVGERREPDGVERARHAREDLVDRLAEVLGPEGHVVAGAREHELRIRILQQQADPPATRADLEAVDGQLSLLLALVGPAEHARPCLQQRRLATAGGAEQQHALTRLDAHVERIEHGGRAPGGSPAPALGPEGGRASRGHEPDRASSAEAEAAADAAATGSLAVDRAASSRPAAKRANAPVRASPRTSSQLPSPAMTAPDTIALAA